MKVLIAYPPITSEKGRPTLGQNRQFQWFSNPSYLFPVVPATAATLLKENDFEVRWNDAIAKELTTEQFNDYILSEQPDLVAMETKTPVVKDHWRIISELKSLIPEAKFALMGDHVTALPEESMVKCPSLDYVITGGTMMFRY